MKDYRPLCDDDMPTLFLEITDDSPNIDTAITTTVSIYNKLKKLNSAKAPGPDGIPKWILKEYADMLAPPVSSMLNTSYQEHKFPLAWKHANVTPTPKENPVKDIDKRLRSISLILTLSKLAEEFVVEKYVAPAILAVINPAQFGGIPHL